MATPEQQNAYEAQCSAISFGDFEVRRSNEYDPSSWDYYEDVVEDNGHSGVAVAGVCLLVLLALVVFSLILCCVPHHWLEHTDFVGISRRGRGRFQRFLAFLFVLGIICCTVVVTASSIWGIVKVFDEVQDVVPEAFDFIEDTETQIDSIHGNLTAAVHNGRDIIAAVRVVLRELEDEEILEALTVDGELQPAIADIIEEIEDSADSAEDSLDTVDEEINDTLDDLLEVLRDAIGYRDEGEGINDAGRIVVVVAFSFFIFFSITATLFALCGASPRCTLFWAGVMWFMLTVAFALVAFLDITKEISRESCLYIDNYAVREITDEVNSDRIQVEELLWYYFRPAEEGNFSLEKLEELWSFPLTDVEDFLDVVNAELFDEAGLRPPYSFASDSTQRALYAAQALLPQASRDIDFVQDLITGDTLHDIHSDFKDLICCTEYDSVETVWKAWVVSSAFGLLLTILMTLHAFISLRFGSRPMLVPVVYPTSQTQKTSAYMAPPVKEDGYSDPAPSAPTVPLRNRQTPSSSVQYPTITPATQKF